MVKFQVGETSLNYHGFAKHHKRMALLIGRTFPDGTFKDYIVGDQLRIDVADNPDNVFENKRNVYDTEKHQMLLVTDKFVWLDNQEYEHTDVPYYSVGAVNTKQTSHIRLTFQFEYGRAYLDYKMNSSGSHAMHFGSLISHEAVRYIIEEIVDEGKGISESGIDVSEDGHYSIIIVDECGQAVDCEVPQYELEQALISIEVYKFEQEIIKNEVLEVV